MLSKLKGFANKIKERNKQAREIQKDENDGIKKTIKQIKYFISGIGILMPIAGVVLIVLVSLMMLAGPIMILTQFITSAVDGIKEFGASLGNFFTSGCYGTDEECLEKELHQREINFSNRIKDVITVYRTNEKNAMNKNNVTKYEGSLVSTGSYSVSIKAPLLVSALNYMDETEENYFQMQQEELACSRLLKMGLLDETNNSCANEGIDNDSPLTWYVQPLSEEERKTGVVDPETTISDQVGYDFDVIWARVSGAGTSNTDPDQCGNYNEVYRQSIEEGIGVVYDTGDNIFEKFVKWVTGDNKTSQLRMLAKHMIKMDLNSTCTTVSTTHDDGTVTYSRSIVNAVSYHYDEDKFRNYLTQEYVPALLLEEHLFYQIDIHRKEYEDLNGTIDTKSKEKAYLNWLDENGILEAAKDDFMKNTETEKYKNDVDKHVETIFEMAEMYEDYMPSYTGGVTCSYAPNSDGTVGNSGKSDVKVQLLTCGSTKGNQQKIGGLIDLEDYVKGVVYGEIDTSFPAEAIKAQAIAARTFALTRQQGMCPGDPSNCWLGYNPSTNIITLRNCTNDQVYCDTENGCSNVDGTLMFGTNVGGKVYKQALSGERKDKFYETVNSTAGMTVVNALGENIVTAYINTTQNKWKAYAEAGLDFNEILMNTYSEGNSLSGGCYFGEALEWKQCGEEWSGIIMGGSSKNICNIGCLVTSVSIQIARSGTTLTVDKFDPGVFVQTLNQNGGFVSGGNFTWSGWSSIAPNFVYAGSQSITAKSMNDLAQQLSGYLNQGYYVVMEVKIPNGQHWVAITGIEENGTIRMADPARNVDILSPEVYPAILNLPHTIGLFQAR